MCTFLENMKTTTTKYEEKKPTRHYTHINVALTPNEVYAEYISLKQMTAVEISVKMK